MPYRRVLPRDLFNEAKLLKCWAQLALMIHDGKSLLRIEEGDLGRGFDVDQDPSDGSIRVHNLALLGPGDRPIDVFSPLNSRRVFPLCFVDGPDDDPHVFEDTGLFTATFLAFVERLALAAKADSSQD